ncbi:Gfo/Idh/MocA family oxidoreductase [Sulfitobacter sp. LCG007]
MSGTPDADTYALKATAAAEIAAPDLPYRPPMPKAYRPRIALVGAGGIAGAHLDAYRRAGWEVVAICNRTLAKAEERAREFFPDAMITDDLSPILSDRSVDVLDITPHPAERVPLIEAALRAGKHVLSQKPFVLDLDTGARLADLADAHGVRLAVNQNGRWAPHMALMRAAVQGGLIGELRSFHAAVHWDHSWILGTPFERIDDIILYDFGIHWFDFLASIAGETVESVHAMARHASGQKPRAPLLAAAMVKLSGGQASLVFDGATSFGSRDTTYISGAQGTLTSEGPDLGQQSVTLTTADGVARPTLEGTWFNDGFRGAMGELLCSIEENREPSHSARGNLSSLALAFAAIASAREGREVAVGEVRALA